MNKTLRRCFTQQLEHRNVVFNFHSSFCSSYENINPPVQPAVILSRTNASSLTARPLLSNGFVLHGNAGTEWHAFKSPVR